MREGSVSRFFWIALLGILVGAGFWMRGLSVSSTRLGAAAWRPWPKSTFVTLYFADGPFFVPVSRRLLADDLPRVALENLLSGPTGTSGLSKAIPIGVRIRSITVSRGVAEIDLSAEFLAAQADLGSAANSVVETLTALPGVHSVALSVEGKPLGPVRQRVPLLYYASVSGLVAVPVSVTNPRDAISRFLDPPPVTGIMGLPSDVRLLRYDYHPSERFVSLNFTYTPSVRTLALEKPERMRFVLLGLIASLTEFSEVKAVQLDFEGRTRLGVGQCSDLLRTRQPRPELFNDERLFGRSGLE